MDRARFSFENLEVWRKSVNFTKTILDITENLTGRGKHFRLIEQLESASTSIALNIAEGKGRYSKKEFIHFLYIARGSLFETISLLIILAEKGLLTNFQLEELKNCAGEIGKMLSGLINSLRQSAQTCNL